MEYLGDCGGHVELDHRLGDLVILLHALAPDDKRSLDLIVGVTTVTGSLMAMFAFPQIPDPWINGMLLLCAIVMLVTLALYANYFLKSRADVMEKGAAS